MFDLGFEFYQKANNAYKSHSQKETTLYEIKADIAQTHQETIDYQEDSFVDGVHMPLIVMEYRGTRLDKNRIKKIEAPPNSVFNWGSKIDCFGLKWLVTDINYNQEVKLAGAMQLCNYVLKWQDDEGNLVAENCVVYPYVKTTNGEYEGRVITVNDTKRTLFIQYNPDTAKFRLGKRFFVDLEGCPDPKPYRLTNLDRISNIYNGKGFFELTLTEDLLEDKSDRPDLMIANYKEFVLPTATGKCEIEFSGTATVKIGGKPKTFRAVFKDNEDNIIDTIAPEWDFILPPELDNSDKILIPSQQYNEIQVQASRNADAGTSFKLILTAESYEFGYFETEIDIEVISAVD